MNLDRDFNPWSGDSTLISLNPLGEIPDQMLALKFHVNSICTDHMEPIPLPSHIHYELLLQLLERKTRVALYDNSRQYEQVNQLIITLRKAFAIQKQLEQSCQHANLPLESCWSLNEINPESNQA